MFGRSPSAVLPCSLTSLMRARFLGSNVIHDRSPHPHNYGLPSVTPSTCRTDCLALSIIYESPWSCLCMAVVTLPWSALTPFHKLNESLAGSIARQRWVRLFSHFTINTAFIKFAFEVRKDRIFSIGLCKSILSLLYDGRSAHFLWHAVPGSVTYRSCFLEANIQCTTGPVCGCRYNNRHHTGVLNVLPHLLAFNGAREPVLHIMMQAPKQRQSHRLRIMWSPGCQVMMSDVHQHVYVSSKNTNLSVWFI